LQPLAITGLGIVSPLGIGKSTFETSLHKGYNALYPIDLFPCDDLPTTLAFTLRSFSPADILGKKGLRLLDRATKIALSAAHLALKDSCLHLDNRTSKRTAVVLGTTTSCITSRTHFLLEAMQFGPRKVNPALFPNTVVNAPASQIAIRFALQGPNATISNGYTSSLECLEYGANLLHSDQADIVLVGGLEELNELIFRKGLAEGSLLSDEATGIWSAGSNGTICGEGAAVLVLEKTNHALQRGAPVYAFLSEVHTVFEPDFLNDSTDITAAGKRVVLELLEMTQLEAKSIDVVISGSNGLTANDNGERAILQEVLHNDCPVLTPKLLTGETASASGAFSSSIAALILQSQTLPDYLLHNSLILDLNNEETAKNRNNFKHVLISQSSSHGKYSAAIITAKDTSSS